MILFATLSAENPNGKPGLLTFSLRNTGAGIKLPVFDWMTLGVSARTEGYLLNKTGSWATVMCSGSQECDGNFNDYVVIRDKDVIDLRQPTFSIDFHIQLWNRD